MFFDVTVSPTCSDCDVSGRLKVSAFMKYAAWAGAEHMDSLQFSQVRLAEMNLAFLLTKAVTDFIRVPRFGEKITFRTAPTSVKGAKFVREYVVVSETGELLAKSNSYWVLADTKTHKVLRPSQLPFEPQFQPPEVDLSLEDAYPKVNEEDFGLYDLFPIHFTYIDSNKHVNNSVYGDFVCNLLPYSVISKKEIAHFSINFLNEAVAGDIVDTAGIEIGDGSYYIRGKKVADGKTCFQCGISFI